MIKSCDKKENKHDLNLKNSIISSVDSDTLLRIEINNKLIFEKHISIICKSASTQWNAISQIQCYIGQKDKEISIKNFVYSHFMYCPLAWHFCSKSSQKL